MPTPEGPCPPDPGQPGSPDSDVGLLSSAGPPRPARGHPLYSGVGWPSGATSRSTPQLSPPSRLGSCLDLCRLVPGNHCVLLKNSAHVFIKKKKCRYFHFTFLFICIFEIKTVRGSSGRRDGWSTRLEKRFPPSGWFPRPLTRTARAGRPLESDAPSPSTAIEPAQQASGLRAPRDCPRAHAPPFALHLLPPRPTPSPGTTTPARSRDSRALRPRTDDTVRHPCPSARLASPVRPRGCGARRRRLRR